MCGEELSKEQQLIPLKFYIIPFRFYQYLTGGEYKDKSIVFYTGEEEQALEALRGCEIAILTKMVVV